VRIYISPLPPIASLFPYTTLFRSLLEHAAFAGRHVGHLDAYGPAAGFGAGFHQPGVGAQYGQRQSLLLHLHGVLVHHLLTGSGGVVAVSGLPRRSGNREPASGRGGQQDDDAPHPSAGHRRSLPALAYPPPGAAHPAGHMTKNNTVTQSAAKYPMRSPRRHSCTAWRLRRMPTDPR